MKTAQANEEEDLPWLKLGHRLKEVPGVLLVLLSGSPERRRRLGRIVKNREIRRKKEPS
jgi:hypothetical protein